MTISLHHGDCLDVLRGLPSASTDALITDPPAGIAFMGASWDGDKGGRAQWVAWLAERMHEARPQHAPGGVGLVWALPRTSHWTALALEDAGFVIEDRVSHIFGSGFPKHKSKLKPAVEDWWLVRAPGPKWLGVEACRVGAGEDRTSGGMCGYDDDAVYAGGWTKGYPRPVGGRWPPHLLLSHSAGCNGVCEPGCPVRVLGEQSGERASGGRVGFVGGMGYGSNAYGTECQSPMPPSTGTAARFFPQFDAPFIYASKASRRERNAGCEGLPDGANDWDRTTSGMNKALRERNGGAPTVHQPKQNHHPTVKPLALMRWLVRLACPPGGTVLDPFLGSGSTGCAAIAEGMDFVGIEQDAEYLAIARARIAHALGPVFQEALP